jgi:hypothetical protein
MDMYFESREEAKKLNDHCKEHWKYLGTAKTDRGYVAWRTDRKRDVKELLASTDYKDVIIDKGDI